MKKKRAVLIFYEGYIGVQPSVVSAAVELHERGYDVDIFHTAASERYPPPALPHGIQLLECKLPQPSGPFRRLAIELRNILRFGLFCRRNYRSVDLALAFDMTGVAAMTIAVPRRVPFVYWSLEILACSEVKGLSSRALKWLETRKVPHAIAVVTQSRERSDLLAADMTIPATVIVPNGPRSLRGHRPPRDFFTARFGIPAGATIVLCAGMIDPKVCSVEIANAARSWPKNFVLVFHERAKRDPDDPYIRAVQSAGGDRIVLSLDPVPLEEIDNVFAGAHIGIVSYAPIGGNLETALGSSGKLVYYLRNGLPVVVIAPARPGFISAWNCGIWVSSFDQIGSALVDIAEGYSDYSRRASECYDDQYNFTASFDRLMCLVENPVVDFAEFRKAPSSGSQEG